MFLASRQMIIFKPGMLNVGCQVLKPKCAIKDFPHFRCLHQFLHFILNLGMWGDISDQLLLLHTLVCYETYVIIHLLLWDLHDQPLCCVIRHMIIHYGMWQMWSATLLCSETFITCHLVMRNIISHFVLWDMHEQLPCYKTHFWPLHVMSHTCLAILFYVVGHDQPVYAMRLI